MSTGCWVIVSILCVICISLMIAALLHSKKPIRYWLTSGLQGLCALGLVNALGGFTGVSLGFSWLSMIVSYIMGMPGVIGLLGISTILGM